VRLMGRLVVFCCFDADAAAAATTTNLLQLSNIVSSCVTLCRRRIHPMYQSKGHTTRTPNPKRKEDTDEKSPLAEGEKMWELSPMP
jgi:hypothetical protein